MGRRRRRPRPAGARFDVTGLTPKAALELADRFAEEGIPARVDALNVYITQWELTTDEFVAFEDKVRALAAEYGGKYSGPSSTIDPWE